MKHWDIMFGFTSGTLLTVQVLNGLGGLLVLGGSIVLLGFRIRREWRRRNSRFVIGKDGRPRTEFIKETTTTV